MDWRELPGQPQRILQSRAKMRATEVRPLYWQESMCVQEINCKVKETKLKKNWKLAPCARTIGGGGSCRAPAVDDGLADCNG